MSKPKYHKGARVSSIGMFEALGTEWFVLNGKTTHRKVIENMTYRTLAGFVRRGQVFAAVPANEKLLGKSARSLTTEEFQYADE